MSLRLVSKKMQKKSVSSINSKEQTNSHSESTINYWIASKASKEKTIYTMIMPNVSSNVLIKHGFHRFQRRKRRKRIKRRRKRDRKTRKKVIYEF